MGLSLVLSQYFEQRGEPVTDRAYRDATWRSRGLALDERRALAAFKPVEFFPVRGSSSFSAPKSWPFG